MLPYLKEEMDRNNKSPVWHQILFHLLHQVLSIRHQQVLASQKLLARKSIRLADSEVLLEPFYALSCLLDVSVLLWVIAGEYFFIYLFYF